MTNIDKLLLELCRVLKENNGRPNESLAKCLAAAKPETLEALDNMTTVMMQMTDDKTYSQLRVLIRLRLAK